MGTVSKPLPIQVILEYLLKDDRKLMKQLVSGLEEHEFSLPKVVLTAVTCNLYKIFYDAGRLTSMHPQEVSDAAVAMSFNQIDALVRSLNDTYIKRIIKNQEYES